VRSIAIYFAAAVDSLLIPNREDVIGWYGEEGWWKSWSSSLIWRSGDFLLAASGVVGYCGGFSFSWNCESFVIVEVGCVLDFALFDYKDVRDVYLFYIHYDCLLYNIPSVCVLVRKRYKIQWHF